MEESVEQLKEKVQYLSDWLNKNRKHLSGLGTPIMITKLILKRDSIEDIKKFGGLIETVEEKIEQNYNTLR